MQADRAKVAVITGITGQSGSYLADLLLEKGYHVHGVVREHGRLGQATHLLGKISFHQIDIVNPEHVFKLLERVQPNEYYNLAAVSFVPRSIEQPLETMSATGMAVVHALEAIRRCNRSIRFFQAGSSEMFGTVDSSPQNENTPFRPQNPYATAKVLAHHAVQNYREHYGIFGCNGILFNHESPRRSVDFVTRKITSSVARIKLGLQSQLILGNLDAKRDWGYAEDFAKAIWLTLQQDKPNDYVIGTGELASVRDLTQLAFELVGLCWMDHVFVDPKFSRPAERFHRVADPARARSLMNWWPSTPFRNWVSAMIDNDLRLADAEARQMLRRAA